MLCVFLVFFLAETITSDLAPVEEEDEDENKERHCDSLIMCIVTTLNEGLRNGGGIGDVLRKPSRTVCTLIGKTPVQEWFLSSSALIIAHLVIQLLTEPKIVNSLPTHVRRYKLEILNLNLLQV